MNIKNFTDKKHPLMQTLAK